MQKKYLYLVAFAHLCCDLNPGALPAILPFFVTDYGMDYKQVAGIMFASSFLASILQPYFGYMADKKSYSWYITLGVTMSGLMLALTGFTKNYWLIFSAITFMGAASSIFHPEGARLINALAGEKKGSAMGIFSIGGNGGFGFGPLLAVAALSAFGMKGTAVFGVIALVVGTILHFTVPKMLEAVKEQQAKEKAEEEKLQFKPNPRENDWPSFRRLTVVIIARSIVQSAINSFLPLFCITVLATTKAVGSSTLSLLYMSGIVATMIGGWAADRFGYVRMLRYGALLLIPVLAAIVYSRNIYVVYAMVIPLSIALNGIYSPFVVLGQNYLAKSIGFASGVTLGLSSSAGGIVLPLLGWYGDKEGLVAVMTVVIGISCLCAAFSFMLKEPRS